jgi:hypothetical protein
MGCFEKLVAGEDTGNIHGNHRKYQVFQALEQIRQSGKSDENIGPACFLTEIYNRLTEVVDHLGKSKGYPAVYASGGIENRSQEISRVPGIFQDEFLGQPFSEKAGIEFLPNRRIIHVGTLEHFAKCGGIDDGPGYQSLFDILHKRPVLQLPARQIIQPQTLSDNVGGRLIFQGFHLGIEDNETT